MANLKLSLSERNLIDKVLQSAVFNSWVDFKSLTDEPFANERSALEQFQDSSKRIRRAGANLDKSTNIELLDDGTRFISTRFTSDDGTNIILTIHSSDDTELSTMGIWNFFQELDLKSLFDS